MREMKDSGLEWLGNVSSDVKLVPLKYLLKKERMQQVSLIRMPSISSVLTVIRRRDSSASKPEHL